MKMLSFIDYVSGIRLSDGSKLAINRKNYNVTICRHDDVLLFLSSLVTDPSFTSVSSLVLELWQFMEFCPISGGWGELGIPNLPRKISYKMLLNAKVTNFTVFELVRENQLTGKTTPSPLRPAPHTHTVSPTKWSKTFKQFVGCCRQIV